MCLHTGTQVNTADPIEFVVATLGPKAAAVAGRRGTGLISFGLLDPTAWHALHDARRHAAGGTPPDPDSHTGSGVDSYVVTSLHILDEDEDPQGDAARDATGHLVLSLLAFAADTPAFADQLGPEEREAVRRLLDRRGTTATAPDRHTKLYPNYLGRIAPQDRNLVLPSLMNSLALVGTRDDILARITTLEQSSIDELLIQPVIDTPHRDGPARETPHLSGPAGRTREKAPARPETPNHREARRTRHSDHRRPDRPRTGQVRRGLMRTAVISWNGQHVSFPRIITRPARRSAV